MRVRPQATADEERPVWSPSLLLELDLRADEAEARECVCLGFASPLRGRPPRRRRSEIDWPKALRRRDERPFLVRFRRGRGERVMVALKARRWESEVRLRRVPNA